MQIFKSIDRLMMFLWWSIYCLVKASVMTDYIMTLPLNGVTTESQLHLVCCNCDHWWSHGVLGCLFYNLTMLSPRPLPSPLRRVILWTWKLDLMSNILISFFRYFLPLGIAAPIYEVWKFFVWMNDVILRLLIVLVLVMLHKYSITTTWL